MDKIIAIGSIRGGVGKTTTTLNLAYALSEMGKKVLTIDFDIQSNLTRAYEDANMDKETTIAHLAMQQLKESLYNGEGTEQILSELLTPLKNLYDYILIDTCPSLNALTINALVAADEVILIAVPGLMEIMGLDIYEQAIAKVKEKFNSDVSIAGVLLTMCESRSDSCEIQPEEVKSYFKQDVRVFETRIPKGEEIILEVYRKFAEELIESGI